MKHEPVEIAIVGGGAAGLMAAAAAKAQKRACVVIERKARIGSKMLMTANGRCNFTKDISAERMLADLDEPVASFVRPALSACPPSTIAAGFKSRGLRLKRMQDGRLFPASEKAADVVHVFGDLLRDEEIPLFTNCAVSAIQPVKNGFIVGLGSFTIWAKNVLLATGGMSFPKTGCFGDGQRIARELGHTIVPCRAGLTGFEWRVPRPGARYERAAASVEAGGETLCRYEGEIDFEPWGVSGAAVYNCSRVVARREIRDFVLKLDTPAGIFRLDSPKMRPLKEAIVTMGGVSLDEVDNRTMQSKLVPGLYFAGEVLDIDGPTGGYNLSLAFATARLAISAIGETPQKGYWPEKCKNAIIFP